ncbi:MAG: hypothetical protein P8K73_03090 [Methylophilaceae bacterium]|jgi:hypothetical protein|nr:hypothetical protein [Methylophilaceae bacterium]
MKKLLLILFLFPYLLFAKESNTSVVKLESLGSDRYSISITENANSNNLKEEFKKEVNKTCGTRFEIESIELKKINHNQYKRQILQGSFKCYVNSQM